MVGEENGSLRRKKSRKYHKTVQKALHRRMHRKDFGLALPWRYYIAIQHSPRKGSLNCLSERRSVKASSAIESCQSERCFLPHPPTPFKPSPGLFLPFVGLVTALSLRLLPPASASLARKSDHSSASDSLLAPPGVSGKSAERDGVLGVRLKGDMGMRRDAFEAPGRAKPACSRCSVNR